jgi:hypothetical protein
MSKSIRILIIILASITVLNSCKSRDKNKVLVPVNELVDVLTELYVADGLLLFPAIRSHFIAKDSILNHIDIIKKHGYTKERMDYTLRYYFEKNPKKLENIYDQVLTKLNEMDTFLEKEISFKNQNPANLWNSSFFIYIPESGAKNPVWFSVPAKDTGNYILEFTSTVFRDDKSLNPRITVFFWRGDSSKPENRINWPEVALPKDGQSHVYSLSNRKSDSTFTRAGGWLLNSDPKKGRWAKHAKFENIIFRKADAK